MTNDQQQLTAGECHDKPRHIVLLDLMIVFPTLFLFISGGSQLLSPGVKFWHLPIAVMLAMAATFYMHRDIACRALIYAASIFLSVLALSIYFASLYVDDWYDSRAYHALAALALADGWSPYLDWSVCSALETYCVSTHIYLDHYAKAVWYISAGFYAFFGQLETLKSFNFYMIYLVFVSAYVFARSLSGVSQRLAGTIAVCFSANPVALAQITSGYIDGIFASYLSVYLLQLLDFSYNFRRPAFRRALLILPVLLNIKLSAIAYVPILTLGFIVLYALRQRRSWVRISFALASAGVFSILVIGFNPYVTNILTRGDPFYPAYSIKSGKSAISKQASPDFIAKDRVSKFFISIFSFQDKSSIGIPKLTLPFTRFLPDGGVDKRFGGFGSLFSGIFLIALLQLFLIRRQWFWLGLIASVMVSIFVTPAVWWARLVPQLWFAVVVLQLAIIVTRPTAWSRYLCNGILLLLLVNSLIVLGEILVDNGYDKVKYFRDVNYVKRENLSIRITGAKQCSCKDAFLLYNRIKMTEFFPDGYRIQENCKPAKRNNFFEICRPR